MIVQVEGVSYIIIFLSLFRNIICLSTLVAVSVSMGAAGHAFQSIILYMKNTMALEAHSSVLHFIVHL